MASSGETQNIAGRFDPVKRCKNDCRRTGLADKGPISRILSESPNGSPVNLGNPLGWLVFVRQAVFHEPPTDGHSDQATESDGQGLRQRRADEKGEIVRLRPAD